MCSPYLDWFKQSWLKGPYPVVVDASAGSDRICPAPTLYNAARDLAEELRSRGATPETILSTRLPPSVAWLTLWLASRRLGAWMVIDASPEGPHTDGTDRGPCLEVSAACTSEIGGFTVEHAPWPSDAPAPRGDGGGLAWLTATGTLVERGEEELVTMLGRPDALRDGAVEVRSKWTGPGDLGDIVAALRGPEELYLPCASR